MININELSDMHVGSVVVFRKKHEPYREFGILKAWNESCIFVVYHYNEDPFNFRDYTGCATNPEDLKFDENAEIGFFREKNK